MVWTSCLQLEGQLQTRQSQDGNDVERWATEMVVKQSGTLQMLGSNRDKNVKNPDQPNDGQPMDNQLPIDVDNSIPC